MVPVSLILVLGKASLGKMDFSVVIRKKRAMLWVGPKSRGGAAFTQKSERLSGKFRRLRFKSGTSLLLLESKSSGIRTSPGAGND